MADLVEKLMAAFPHESDLSVALAAARMALEEAAQASMGYACHRRIRNLSATLDGAATLDAG